MVVITLLGELQAKKDEIFVYCGPLADCRDCRLKTVCFNLDEGKWYRVNAVRDIHHDCRIHEDGVRVVEAEPVGIPASIPARYAVEGTTIQFEPRLCNSLKCENRRLCRPVGIPTGARYQITTVKGEISCENGKSLRSVIMC